ncbi:MAG: hypothetical protein U0793_10720 [Gemmataceae bacterium]
MTPALSEQRNAYKGSPLRPWVRLRLVEKDGAPHDVQVIADTGNPFAVIISEAAMAKLTRISHCTNETRPLLGT